MRELAMYASGCFMIAGLIGLALLVLEFALGAVRDFYAKMEPIPAVPTRPASRQRHYGWGIEPGANPYAEYAVKPGHWPQSGGNAGKRPHGAHSAP